MIIVQNEKCSEYFRKIGMSRDNANAANIAADYKDNDHLTIPFPSIERLNRLSYIISIGSGREEWKMLYISEFSINPECEDLNLYYSFSKHHGSMGTLDDNRGHVFQSYEYHELASLTTICILNAFDSLIISRNDYTRISTSHHGFIDIYTKDPDIIKAISENLNVS